MSGSVVSVGRVADLCNRRPNGPRAVGRHEEPGTLVSGGLAVERSEAEGGEPSKETEAARHSPQNPLEFPRCERLWLGLLAGTVAVFC